MKRDRERRDSYYGNDASGHRDVRDIRDRDDEVINTENVSTVHVRNLPLDVKERELRLLTCFLPGFESAMVTSKDNSPIGFIKFSSQTFALSAINSLQGFIFDAGKPDTALKVSLAKRDMNLRHSARTTGFNSPAHPSMMYSSGFPYGSMGVYTGGDGLAAYASAFTAAVAAQRPDIRSLNAVRTSFTVEARSGESTCDTLCLRGLPASVTESDIEKPFLQSEGYQCMKLLSSKSLAFLKFQSDEHAGKALDQLAGSTLVLLGSTGRASVLLEYAKRSLEIR